MSAIEVHCRPSLEALEDEQFDVFLLPQFFRLHEAKFSRTFNLQFTLATSAQVVACAQLAEKTPGHFYTPIIGSYGGIQAIKKKSTLPYLEAYWQALAKFLQTQNCQQLTWVTPPMHYSSQVAGWFNVLTRHGFTVTHHDLNYAIAIDAQQNYRDRIDYSCRKKLKRGSLHQLSVRQLSTEEYQLAHQIISDNRARKGRQLSMDFAAVLAMHEVFPENLKLFGVFQQQKLIAAAITLLVNPEILYVYAWGECEGVNEIAPVIFIAEHLYQYCVKNNIRLLDLGISSVNAQPNCGLIRFKENLAATTTIKWCLSKKFS